MRLPLGRTNISIEARIQLKVNSWISSKGFLDRLQCSSIRRRWSAPIALSLYEFEDLYGSI